MSYSYGPPGRNCIKIYYNGSSAECNADMNLICCAKAIYDLLEVRDGTRLLPGFDKNDVELMIEDLCCD